MSSIVVNPYKWDCDPIDFDMTHMEPLGCGAISVVSKAQHRDNEKCYALKIVSKLQATQQQKVQDVMNEKKALYALAPHPFIVTIYATMQSHDELFFVLEWLPHGDLQEHCVRNGALPVEDVQAIVPQILVAMEQVFAKGFVLRDLKPENFGFDVNYRLRLFDFDTVSDVYTNPNSNEGRVLPDEPQRAKGEKRRVTVSEIQSVRKNTAQFCGTAQYVSPEMLGRCQWSFSSDLWALGILVFRLLTGRLIFDGAGSYEIMKKIVAGVTKEELRKIAVDVPETGLDFVFRLLNPDPILRLGVDKDTQTFDFNVLRNHPFLSESDHCKTVWQRIDGALATEKGVLWDPEEPEVESSEKSFKSLYKVVPSHAQSYSQYVMDAPAGAFDQYAMGTQQASSAPEETITTCEENNENRNEGAPPAPGEAVQEIKHGNDDDQQSVGSCSSSSSGSLDIIDDTDGRRAAFCQARETEGIQDYEPFAFGSNGERGCVGSVPTGLSPTSPEDEAESSSSE